MALGRCTPAWTAARSSPFGRVQAPLAGNLEAMTCSYDTRLTKKAAKAALNCLPGHLL